MSREVWIVNASPLISLSRVEQLGLLVHEDRALVVPALVAGEVRAGAATDLARQALEAGFGGSPVQVALSPRVVEWGLGLGETAVLSLALEREGTAIVDDLEARRAAKALGVPVIGTLGVVLLARRQGRIPSAARVLRDLRQAGARLDETLIRNALARFCGETWEP